MRYSILLIDCFHINDFLTVSGFGLGSVGGDGSVIPLSSLLKDFCGSFVSVIDDWFS